MARKVKNEDPDPVSDGLQNPFASVPVDRMPGGEAAKPGMGRVALRMEMQRGARKVIVIDDFAESVTRRSLEDLSRKLQDACRCTGTIRERTIQLQADRVDQVRDVLEHEGFSVSGA
jgi:translation initiation factor 1 (eIF-1/SUI1)